MEYPVIGLLNLQGPNYMEELSPTRPMASDAVCRQFRLMDFALSSMVNAGVDTVGLLLPFHSRSVLDHVRSGKEWNLARKQRGLFYLPVDTESEVSAPQPGDIHMYYKNLRFVEVEQNRYLLLSGCDVVHNTDYDAVFHFHRAHNADITLVYKELTEDTAGEAWVVETGGSGRVHSLKRQVGAKAGEKLFLGAVLLNGDLFVTMVRQAYAQDPNQYLKDVLARNVKHLRIYGYEYKGYAKRILSLEDYFRASMDMLDINKWREVFRRDRKIYTKIKDEAPAKYMADAKVTNSLAANGCIIEGTVENSILFRKVRVGRNAVVRNSILMQNTVIGDEAQLDYVLCDKNRSIQPEARLAGTAEEPLTIVKHEVV